MNLRHRKKTYRYLSLITLGIGASVCAENDTTPATAPPPPSEAVSSGLLPNMPNNVVIDNNGSIEYLRDKQQVIYTSDKLLKMKTDTGIEAFANKAIVDLKTKTITLTGNLSIFQADSLTRGNSAVYEWESENLKTNNMQAKAGGVILRTGDFQYMTDTQGRDVIIASNASVTTEDRSDPDTWLEAERIRIYPKRGIDLSQMWMKYQNIPFFYFPYFAHSLNPKEGYIPYPGMRSYWGMYLLNSYGILFGNKRIKEGVGIPWSDYVATIRADYRTRRGLGMGLDIEETELVRKATTMTGLSMYFLEDTGANISQVTDPRPPMSSQRHRIALQQYWKLPVHDGTNSLYRLKSNINILSDEYILRDFFPDLFQIDAFPDNTASIERYGSTSVFNILNRFSPNDFYLTDSRTEMSFDRVRGPLGKSSIIYESSTRAGYLQQVVPPNIRVDLQQQLSELSPNDPNRAYYERLLNTGGFLRFHTDHEFSTSFKLKQFFNVTPRIGGSYTAYRDVETVGSDNHANFYAASDFDIKISKRYLRAMNRSFGVNTMNHIIQPYGTIAVITTNSINPLTPQIDSDQTSTNPMPLALGRFTGIDSISNSGIFRYGIRQTLTTQRDSKAYEWLSWDTFMDSYFKDPQGDRQFSNVFSRLRWRPLPWVSYSSDMQVPVIDPANNFKEFNNDLTFKPTRATELSLGHRYLANHPLLDNGSHFNMRAAVRINERMAATARWYIDLNTKKMTIQEYAIFRNMGAWHLGVNFFSRQNGTRNELGVGFSFTIQETGDQVPINFM